MGDEIGDIVGASVGDIVGAALGALVGLNRINCVCFKTRKSKIIHTLRIL